MATITLQAASSASIPTIERDFIRVDLSNYEERREEIVKTLMEAATQQGFFYVVNHGIPIEDIRSMFKTSHDFFALPDDIKAKYGIDVKRNAGWEKLAQVRPSTGVADLKESMQLSYYGIDDLWPTDEDIEGFKTKSQQFMHKVDQVSKKLLECLAIGLGFDAGFFNERHDITKPDILNTLRLLHYHDITGQSFPDEYYRAGAHTDFDTLTLLFQRPGENGLEVCPGREATTAFGHGDNWTSVNPNEGEIVCNIGDMLMRWSDDRLKSNFHRVRTPKIGEYQGPRYSIAYFNQANKSSIIQGQSIYTDPISAEDFLKQAMERNYNALQATLAKNNKQASLLTTEV
ncbi:hypothetical protein BJ944DRAFT_282167 [Cunninghamella echinulata]|nr:hypothetical protein BJ944DRAFT_282167 [Cunninghamella echinulata]